MKITCQSCHSKYNVADEKVQGKVVKIRCRKCGSTIAVDGTGRSAANGSAATAPTTANAGAAPDAGASEAQVWHVNVAEDEQRTMGIGELVEAFQSGVVTYETFVWTEGMDDWRALGEVDALLPALQGASSSPAAAGSSSNGLGGEAHTTSIAAPGTQEPPSPDDEALDGADPTRIYGRGDQEAAYAAQAPQIADSDGAGSRLDAKRAAVRRDSRSRDLFASRVSTEEVRTDGGGAGAALLHMGGVGAGGEEDAAAKRLGERNENSVLFSLAMLTKTAETRATDDRGSGRADDDSGLIDLKALAAKTESLRPGATAGDAGMFASPLGAMPPLGAPLGAAGASLGDTPGKNRLRAVVAGGAVLALVVACIAIGVKLAGTRAPITPPPTAAAATAAPAETAAVLASAPATAAAPIASASAAPSPAAPAAARPRAGGGAWVARPQVAASRPATGAGSPAGASAPAPPAKKAGGDCGCNGDLMCLMKCSTH